MQVMTVFLIACLAISAPIFPEAQQQGKIETVDIDGRKNPELVPDYVAWRQSLRILKTLKRDELPGPIFKVATDADFSLIREEAARLDKVEEDCNARLLRAREPLQQSEQTGSTKEKRLATAREVAPEMWDIELGCRWETIKARDRLIEKLTPDTSTAVRVFTDTVRSGISLTIPKSGLERFRQPQ